MSDPTAHPAAEVAEPFYSSTHRYRNLKSALLLAIVPLFAIVPVYVMIRGVPAGHYFTGQWFFLTCVAIGFIAGFLKLLYSVVADVRHPVRIDTAGVLLPSGRFVPWHEVASLRFDRGPFARRGYLACATTEEPTLFRSLYGERLLSPDDAAQVLERIGRFLAASHPNVNVALPRPRPTARPAT